MLTLAETTFTTEVAATPRHRTAYLAAGPADGRLIIFLHGWPELGLIWRKQMEHFAAAGWRCIAPDMRGYGGSSVPDAISAYAVRELVADMLELHDSLGAKPAVWVGHDWGSAPAWSIASHHARRCRAVVNLCVPYMARGVALPNLIPLIDRELYPEAQFPVGQWDYWLFYREHFHQAALAFEADVAVTFTAFFRTASAAAVGKPAITASIRARNSWFGDPRRSRQMPRDEAMLSQADFEAFVAAFRKTGFRGADSWYMNDALNLAYAAEAPNFGRLTVPALFLHAEYDTVCDTVHSRLADPMREDCADLTEVTISGGHELMLEKPDEVNQAIDNWLSSRVAEA